MAKDPALDLTLTPVNGDARSLNDWMKTFNLVSVIVDPYTNESSWVLPAARRILHAFRDAAVRVNFVSTSDAADAKAFLGPIADEFLTFADADRSFVRSLGLTHLPAFVYIRHGGSLAASAEGWDPKAWRDVAGVIAKDAAWTKPSIPGLGDPAAFLGSPAL